MEAKAGAALVPRRVAGVVGVSVGILWLDFETRSRCDLKACGVYNYAQDISTEVLCLSLIHI